MVHRVAAHADASVLTATPTHDGGVMTQGRDGVIHWWSVEGEAWRKSGSKQFLTSAVVPTTGEQFLVFR